MWTESHKICKVWAFINHVIPRCFRSYESWLNKSNHQVKQVDIRESIIINQSISMNLFHPIEALVFNREFLCFCIIHHNSRVSTHLRRVCYSNKWKAWHLCSSILKLLMVTLQQLISLPASKICKKTNVQQVILHVSCIFWVWTNVLTKISSQKCLTDSPIRLWWYNFKCYFLINFAPT